MHAVNPAPPIAKTHTGAPLEQCRGLRIPPNHAESLRIPQSKVPESRSSGTPGEPFLHPKWIALGLHTFPCELLPRPGAWPSSTKLLRRCGHTSCKILSTTVNDAHKEGRVASVPGLSGSSVLFVFLASAKQRGKQQKDLAAKGSPSPSLPAQDPLTFVTKRHCTWLTGLMGDRLQ